VEAARGQEGGRGGGVARQARRRAVFGRKVQERGGGGGRGPAQAVHGREAGRRDHRPDPGDQRRDLGAERRAPELGAISGNSPVLFYSFFLRFFSSRGFSTTTKKHQNLFSLFKLPLPKNKNYKHQGLTREYVATLSRKPTRRELEAIADGCEVDGALVKPLAVYAPPAESGGDPLARNRVRVVVSEGRNHEVRKLVAAAGADVAALKRVRVGGYRLPGDLGIGGVRELKPYEAARVADKGLQSNTSADVYAV